MLNENELKVYQTIGTGRLLNVKVILDDNIDNPIYIGQVDNAPEEIKALRYSKIEINSPITYYIYSKFN